MAKARQSRLDFGVYYAAYYVVPEPVLEDRVHPELKRPKVYTAAAVIAVHAYGLFLVIPFLAAVVVLSLYIAEWALVVPFVAIAVTAFILPFGLGNPHVCRLVRSFCPAAAQGNGFIVQLTYQPRFRSGLMAIIEDADDIGWLCFTEKAVVFEGDSTRFEIPYADLLEAHPRTVGLRGLYVYGTRLELKVRGLPNVESVLFAERSSWILPGSRRITRRLWQQALARVPKPQPAATLL